MKSLLKQLHRATPIYPLVSFRIIFGGLMFVATLRTMLLGWVDKFYLEPQFFFKYYGFEWISVCGGAWGIYTVYVLLLLSSLGIMLGAFYRFSSILFFILFTYTELLDVTHYLNHYYLVTCISFLSCCLPLHQYLSVDVYLNPNLKRLTIPYYCIFVLQLQLAIVYFYAGIAKLHSDWLLDAQPLRIWLAQRANFPLLGPLLSWPSTALLFAWAGAIFDLSIPFLLWWKKSRVYAYVSVLLFHLMTAMLFYIGLFPYFMMGMTIIFFSTAWHKKIITIFGRIFILTLSKLKQVGSQTQPYSNQVLGIHTVYRYVLIGFMSFQLLFPLRHWLYPGNVLWTEEGFRFAWKVMVLEKRGHAVFTVTDGERTSIVRNLDFLTEKQELMMSYQADLILQFAKHLAKVYQQKGYQDPVVTVDCQVSWNGRLSRPYIDPKVNLAQQAWNLYPKAWIIRYPKTRKNKN